MVNKKENTTMIIPKSLRDSLLTLKYKYSMTYTYEVVQLLLNTFDKTKLEEPKNEN